MEEKNAVLTKQNLDPMIIEELIASLLYTGPVRPARLPFLARTHLSPSPSRVAAADVP